MGSFNREDVVGSVHGDNLCYKMEPGVLYLRQERAWPGVDRGEGDGSGTKSCPAREMWTECKVGDEKVVVAP